MSVTHKFHVWVQNGSENIPDQNNEVSAGSEVKVDENVGASQTDYQINVAIDFSAMQSLMILSSQDCTLETNSGAAPDDTINLEAGVPIFYRRPTSGSIPACPLTADVTAVFITNTTALNLKIWALVDPTP